MKKLSSLSKLFILSLLSSLSFASAQGINAVRVTDFGNFITTVNKSVVGSIGILLLSLSVVAFFAGMVRFIWSMRQGEGKAAEAGKKFMLWGLLSVFTVFSIYGIVYFMQTTLGVNGITNIGKPCLDFVSDCKNNGATYTPVTTSPATGGGDPSPNITNSDDCLKRNLEAGSSCVLLDGTGGSCVSVFGSLVCQNTSVTPTNGGIYVDPATQNSDCARAGIACTNMSGTSGTCTSDGTGSYYCRTSADVVSDNDSTKCLGKSLWATCSYGGSTGFCYNTTASEGGAQLYCAINTRIIGAGGYCQPEAKTSVCGKGLSCVQSGVSGGTIYYKCK